MNKHLNDGQLRASLDGELNSQELQHLEACIDCRTRQKMMQAQTQKISENLTFLSSAKVDSALPTQIAWNRFKKQKLAQKETYMIRKLFASPLIRYGLPVLVIMTLIFAMPGARALASQLLDLFRVQQVTVIPVDVTGMEQLDGAFGNQLGELISDSITMTQKPGDPLEAADTNEASQLAGFTVRVPQEKIPTRINVMNGSAFTLTIDREKAQALLEEAGRGDLILPESVDGSEIAVNIPTSVTVNYGTCPPPSSDGDGFEMNSEGSPGRRYADCIILAEVPSPTVTAPASVDVAQLAQIALEFTGMTSEEAAAFTDTVDWTSTLVIPIPKNAATYEQIPVDGVTGTLIQRPSDDSPQFTLIWVKDGIIYAIAGLGSDSQQAIELANSIP